MIISKKQFAQILRDMPAKIDADDLIERIYIKQKLEAAEEDVRHGRVVSHAQAVREMQKWFKK